MHRSAFQLLEHELERLFRGRQKLRILEVGSKNGYEPFSLKKVCERHNHEHVGVDLVAGGDVDQLLDDPYSLPFDNRAFDIVIAASVFQSVPYFWLLAAEMTRVLAKNGSMVLCLASRGHDHPSPFDCYRFYPQSIPALAAWCSLKVDKITDSPLVKDPDTGRLDYAKISDGTYWGEIVGVLQKPQDTMAEVLDGQLAGLRAWGNSNQDILKAFPEKTTALDLEGSKGFLKHGSYDVEFPLVDGVTTPRIHMSVSKGYYESKEAALAIKYLKGKPRQKILELGAGLGFMSTVLSKTLKDPRILSIEADPRLMDYIAAVHRHNGVTNAIVNNCIATQSKADLERGHIKFVVRSNFWGSSVKHKPQDGTHTVDVKVKSLQSYVDLFEPTALIIDIEGGEADIFQGLSMPSVNFIIIELHPHMIGAPKVAEVMGLIKKAGLKLVETLQDGEVAIFKR